MNSIEAVNELDRPGQAPGTVGRRQALPAAAEVMRLYVRDEKRYVLHAEGDFQTVMKEAEQLYKAGKDVLVNEKSNHLHVHAKSNLHNEVDVGREITPTEKDGVYVQGKGEVVLDSFFEKLPLVDTAIAKPGAEARRPLFDRLDAAAQAPGQQGPAKAPAERSQGDLITVDSEAGSQDAASVGNKPILKKTGYELPAHVADAYTVKGGRFIEKGSDKVLFEDHGKKLSTALEDRAVIEHMVDVAEAKKWQRIELTGTNAFRQMAWLEAESRGIHASGYEPSTKDLELLEKAKKERGVSIEAGAAPQPANNITVSTERQVEANNPAASSPAAPGVGQDQAPVPLNVTPLDAARAATHAAIQAAAPAAAAPAPAATTAQAAERAALDAEAAQGKNGPIVGRLVDHGHAKFNDDPDEKDSYFVRLQTPAGERKVWGKDLERAISEGQFQAGDSISLERKGWEPVTVDANVRDDAGKVIGTEEIAARRNVWEAKPAGLVVMRELSPDEKLKADAAYKVLDNELAKYPAEVRREIVSRFTEAVEKGGVKLPTPQVQQRSEPSRPEPAPERELERAD